MAFTISNVLSRCPTLQLPVRRDICPSISTFPASSVRFSKIISRNGRMICAAASAAGSSGSDGDVNPYELLGVNPIEGFDMVKAAYTKKRRDAERRGDEAAASQLERAYDKIMMAQLMKRKKGEIYGSFQLLALSSKSRDLYPSIATAFVSKDIKYADKAPLIPWGPRYCKSEIKDVQINLAISAVFTAWIFVIRSAEWLPLQFLSAVYVYRIFEKLKASEAPQSPTFTDEGEDESRLFRMGKRLLRSASLVFGSLALSSVAFTMLLNVIEYTGNYIPQLLYNSQDLFVTAVSAAMLFLVASYYR
ncbi:hypothetical protein V2J09_001139 [Rumex salicifolius]